MRSSRAATITTHGRQVDEHGKFREKNFQRAVSKLASSTLEAQVGGSVGRSVLVSW
jgi:hypothetical protein